MALTEAGKKSVKLSLENLYVKLKLQSKEVVFDFTQKMSALAFGMSD